MRRKTISLAALVMTLALSSFHAPAQADLDFLNHNQPLLDAHNCYPYEGHGTTAFSGARSGYPVSIEQDLAWYVDPATGKGRVVVRILRTSRARSLRSKIISSSRFAPSLKKLIAENKRSQWPVIVLHFDFKDNQAPLLQAVWQVLGEHQDWLSTAVKTNDPATLSPIDRKPILVVTEESDEQQKVFYDDPPLESACVYLAQRTSIHAQRHAERTTHALAGHVTPGGTPQ